jgi:hypothetical protein
MEVSVIRETKGFPLQQKYEVPAGSSKALHRIVLEERNEKGRVTSA